MHKQQQYEATAMRIALLDAAITAADSGYPSPGHLALARMIARSARGGAGLKRRNKYWSVQR